MTPENPLILVINCGSSSLKFAVFSLGDHVPLMSGLAEALGQSDARITVKTRTDKKTDAMPNEGHAAALDHVLAHLEAHGWRDSVVAVGHRVVHGGEHFTHSVVVTDHVIADIEGCTHLAPLHNGAHLIGIRTGMEKLSTIPHVVVMDTAFHQTMPEEAYLYAIPLELYHKHGVRRYGFHGTSYRYVAGETVKMLDLDPTNYGLVICHLGNGASVAAIKNGQSVDTSMGMTPLEGLMMGTRSGDIDPGALFHLAKREGYTLEQLDTLLNKQSGFLGVSGLSNDCRTIEEEAAKGHEGAQRAMAVFAHRLAKYIGGLAMALHRLDGIVFTGGIGENSSVLRAMTMERLKVLGVQIDDAANTQMCRGKAGLISTTKTPAVVVVPTNEEWMIAQDTADLTINAKK